MQTATDLTRALVLEAAIWRSGSDPSVQDSLRSLRIGLDGARWGQEREAIRRQMADPENTLRPSDLGVMANKLGIHRGARLILRMIRGAILGTLRRATGQRFLGEIRDWPELRPTAPNTQLWHLIARSAASSGARAWILESQSRNIEQALRVVAAENE